jgi:hypothetical protein
VPALPNHYYPLVDSVDSFSERSGKKNKINTEITGSIIPIKNHLIGLRPIRLANDAVINGMLNRASNPNDINKAAPI